MILKSNPWITVNFNMYLIFPLQQNLVNVTCLWSFPHTVYQLPQNETSDVENIDM